MERALQMSSKDLVLSYHIQNETSRRLMRAHCFGSSTLSHQKSLQKYVSLSIFGVRKVCLETNLIDRPSVLSIRGCLRGLSMYVTQVLGRNSGHLFCWLRFSQSHVITHGVDRKSGGVEARGVRSLFPRRVESRAGRESEFAVFAGILYPAVQQAHWSVLHRKIL